ncbi:ZP2 protein, partial [Amia calva]|nr:ZP2 protein [Amia calva]
MNTTCLGNLMIMDVDSSLTWGNHFIFNVMDPTGKFIPLTPALATQCGYSISVDHWGNVKFIASVLSCFAENNARATTAENDIWQIVFHLPKEKAMTVHQAMSEGYGVNTTYSRIVLRTPYNTSESQSQLIQGVPLSVVRSTTFYKQRWMILMVDTAVACPIDGTTFTEEMITWAVPQIITPLVPTLPISNVDVQLGVNNEILLPSTIIARNYNLTVGPNVVIVQFPVGATGGYYKSHVIPDSAHGIYGITYTIDPFLVYSWEDDTYDKTKYTLLHPITTPFMPRPPHVNFPPTVTGYCDLANFYVNATNGNLGKNWLLVVGTRTLTPAMETEYTYQETATSVLMTVPYNSPDVVYELVSSSEIRSRLDLALKDSAKLWIYTNFSISCSFPLKMIECYTNGTMTALAVKVESVPSLNPSQLTLRDPSCKPSLSTDGTAFFHFNVNTCQTTRKFASNIMTYENEVQWTSPTITYRFAIACHYYINDTEVVSLEPMDNPAPVVEPVLGMITVVIKLALDVSYNSFYGSSDYPVVKYLQEPLYFEVELLNRQDPQVELFLENCWATASTDRDRSPQWDIIIDSCGNTEDLYKTIFHPVTANQRVLFPSHLKRFEVKMFTFTNEQTVLETPIYVHCGVVICDANQPSDGVCRGQCIPGKQRFGKCENLASFQLAVLTHLILKLNFSLPIGRSADRKNRVVVSSGPIDVGAGSHS